jgi:hypothetical protein
LLCYFRINLLVIRPVFAVRGDYSPRQRKGCEVKR